MKPHAITLNASESPRHPPSSPCVFSLDFFHMFPCVFPGFSMFSHVSTAPCLVSAPVSGGHRLALLGPHAAASMDLIQVDTGAVCPRKAAEWNGDTGDDGNFWRLGGWERTKPWGFSLINWI